jgi:hypothetical protein
MIRTLYSGLLLLSIALALLALRAAAEGDAWLSLFLGVGGASGSITALGKLGLFDRVTERTRMAVIGAFFVITGSLLFAAPIAASRGLAAILVGGVTGGLCLLLGIVVLIETRR